MKLLPVEAESNEEMEIQIPASLKRRYTDSQRPRLWILKNQYKLS